MAEFKEHPVYKQVLADSFGGIMYDVANRGKYDSAELIAQMEEYGIHRMDGIAKGAYGFLKEREA